MSKYCQDCKKNVEVDTDSRHSVCTECGNVLEENAIVSEVGFSEGATGVSNIVGVYVDKALPGRMGSVPGGPRQPRAETLENGRRVARDLAHQLGIRQDSFIEQAHGFYRIGIQKNFIQGRRTEFVIAACLYVVCRRNRTAHMLIDFSDAMQVNLYVLGVTYLKLAQVLCLKFPVVDPSLYIHRFASKLEFGPKANLVSKTALRLIQGMKRDWMQTGRRPSGVCGAALFIAAKAHKFHRTITDVIAVVRVGESTIKRRLTEFADTETGDITVEEFSQMIEKQGDPLEIEATQSLKAITGATEVRSCAHCEGMVEIYDKGLCKECYVEFIKVSGGCFKDSRDPSAFTKNRELDSARAQANLALGQTNPEALEAASSEMLQLLGSSQFAELEQKHDRKAPVSWVHSADGGRAVMLCSLAAAPAGIITTTPPGGGTVACFDQVINPKVVVTAVVVPDTRVSTTRVRPRETEVLDSDDDDDETNNAKLSAEETGKRTRIWEEMNKDYLQAQKDRERLIRLGILKPRTTRKRKNEASTAEEAVASMMQKKHISGVETSTVQQMHPSQHTTPLLALPSSKAVDKAQTGDKKPTEAVQEIKQPSDNEEDDDDDDDDDDVDADADDGDQMMSQSRMKRMQSRNEGEEEEFFD